MSHKPDFRLIFRAELTCSGVASDNGALAGYIRSDDSQAALFWLSDEADKSLHLGYFSNENELNERAERFIKNPETTPALALTSDQAKALRGPEQHKALPIFTGVFGTAFSGYLLKEDSEEGIDDDEHKLMLFYTADYRSELLGVLEPEAALKVMTEHYDNRRKRCMLC